MSKPLGPGGLEDVHDCQWKHRYEVAEADQVAQWKQLSDELLDAMARTNNAEAECDRLREQNKKLDKYAEQGNYWLSRFDEVEAERDRLREALQQIVDWTGLTPTNVLRMGVREFARHHRGDPQRLRRERPRSRTRRRQTAVVKNESSPGMRYAESQGSRQQ